MAKFDFYAKGSTLTVRVNQWASSVMFRAEKTAILRDRLETLKEHLASGKKLQGTVLYSPEDLKATVLAIRATEEELAGVGRLPDASFSFTSPADKALRKAWKETPNARTTALKTWFNAHGVPGDDETFLTSLVDALAHKRKNSTEKIVMDGEKWAVDANISFPVLFAILVDKFFELSLMKADLVPESLKDIYAAKRDAAKAKREAKKKAKKAKADTAAKSEEAKSEEVK